MPGWGEGDDQALGLAFIAGDDDAFVEVYRRHATPIHDFIRWTVRDAEAAADLTQATFLRAYERRPTLRDPDALRGWLYRIAHNLAVNHLTRTRLAVPLDDDLAIPWGDPGPEEIATRAEAIDLVWDAAASLEPRQFAVLDLSLRKGLSTPEIAEALGLDKPAASLAVHRAREALGNAVRYLLVARRRSHCDRLAELVPEGTRRLTPEQRATVDRHLRRCPECQRMAVLVSQPAEMFALAPLATLPLALRVAPTVGGGPSGGGAVVARPSGRGLLAGGTAGVLAVAVVTGLIVASQHRGVAQRGSADHAPTIAGPTTGLSTAADLASIAAKPLITRDVDGAADDVVYTSASCPSHSCFVVGSGRSGGVVAVSTDGGVTWHADLVDGADGLTAVACTSDVRCVVGGFRGSNAVFFTTEDGGRDWVASTTPGSAVVTTVRCPDDHDCLAIGELPSTRTASVLASTDGGRSWSRRGVPRSTYGQGYLAGERCLDAQHCWVVGDDIWFTADLGRTWRSMIAPAPTCHDTICGEALHTLTDVFFTSPRDGWVVGGVPGGGYGVTQQPSYLAHTTDGGGSWREEPDKVQAEVPYAVQIACGDSACLMAGITTTDSVISVKTGDGSSWHPVARVAGFVNALACSPDESACVLALGRDGRGGAIATTSPP